jgi:anhydro-N-acetylmuramic acid kinase
MTVASLMSGTSLDGMDVVVAHLEDDGRQLAHRVLDRVSAPYPESLRQRLRVTLDEPTAHLAEVTQLHADIGTAYAELLADVCHRHTVDLIALSGQNVYHVPRVDPARGWRRVATLQLGEAALVLERCRVPVACDFRQSDMAAGGQGAPMVAFGDLRLHHRPGVGRAVHNIGGISNLTYLPPGGDPERVVAFDTGPGTCLIDEAAERLIGRPYDEDGRVAARGRVAETLLARLMQHPYLDLPYPKTTGREVFALDRVLAGADDDRATLTPDDLIATLTAFTAASIARGYAALGSERPLDEVLVAGGGARNPALMTMLRSALEFPVRTFEEIGLDSRDREALAFAVMAYAGYHGRANTLPAGTGARRAVVAGKYLWPRPSDA